MSELKESNEIWFTWEQLIILFLGFKFGSMVYILPHEAKNEMYDAQLQNELAFKVRENLQLTNTDKKPLPACHH